MTLKQLTGKLHLWLGLSSGLVVFILGVTGCILAFENELKELIYRDHLYISASPDSKLSTAQYIENAKKALPEGMKVSGLGFYKVSNHTVTVTAYKPLPPGGWNYFNAVASSYTVYLHPGTAKVVHVQNSKLEFFRLILMLHYDLLLDRIGKQIIGWSTLIFIVLLISGLVLWWPKSRAAAKLRFSFKWKQNTRWRRKNYDLHNILGFYALLFSLIIALTGLVWAFRWFDEGMQWVFNGGSPTPVEKEYHSDQKVAKQAAVFDYILRDMQQRSDHDYYYIGIPEGTSASIYAYAQTEPLGYRWTSFYYDQHTGRNLSTTYYDQKTGGEKMRSMNYYIHTGAIAGLPGQALAFLVSFICAGLPISGFYIWCGRRCKQKG